MPNQRDVAILAGVSSASVSRFLKNPCLVSPDTAKNIREAIESSGYRLDYFARSLKTGRSHHVGILLPGIGPFYWEVLQVIQDQLTRAGYFNTTFYTRDIDSSIHSSRDMLKKFLSNNMIEGVIFFPLDTPEDIEIMRELRRFHEHIVVVDRGMDDKTLNQIFIDNKEAGRNAAQAFLDEGHSKLLYLHGKENSYAAQMRRQGFVERLQEVGISLEENRIIHGDYTATTAYTLAKEGFSRLPDFTGVFAVSDASAIGFLCAARECGLDCPKDFSLIGFDNNKEFTPYTKPSLTTFQQPLGTMGILAAKRLISQIDGHGDTGMIMLQAHFIRRESLAAASDT